MQSPVLGLVHRPARRAQPAELLALRLRVPLHAHHRALVHIAVARRDAPQPDLVPLEPLLQVLALVDVVVVSAAIGVRGRHLSSSSGGSGVRVDQRRVSAGYCRRRRRLELTAVATAITLSIANNTDDDFILLNCCSRTDTDTCRSTIYTGAQRNRLIVNIIYIRVRARRGIGVSSTSS